MAFSINGTPFWGPDKYGVDWDSPDLNWWDAPAPRFESGTHPRAHGVWAGESWLDSRTLRIKATVAAPSHDVAVEAINRLNAALSLTEVPIIFTDGDRESMVMARRSDQTLILWENALIFTWSAQMLAIDPRKHGQALSATAGLPSVAGGLTVGAGQTLGKVPFSIQSTIVSGFVTLENPGNLPGLVQLRLDGPLSGPVVTHAAGETSEVFAVDVDLSEGEYLIVDMANHNALAQGQVAASRSRWITSRGWQAFEPGSNSWSLGHKGGSATGTLTVTATPAWL